MRRYLTTAILLFLVTNLFAQTTIAIKVIHPNAPNIQIIKKTDLLFEKESEESFAINTNETLIYKLDITKPTVLKLVHDFRNFEFFIEPNDQLEVEIDGDIFPNDLIIKGKGSAHNIFLAQFRQEFIPISHKAVLKKLYNSNAADYKIWVDDVFSKKWKIYHAYDESKKNTFSTAFKTYLEAEINYWRAYYLMRYYDEHLSILTNEHYYIPDDFYTFLDEIQINNEAAMPHIYYRNFLKLYANFRLENKAFSKGLASRQRILNVAAPSIDIFPDEKCRNQPIGKIWKGTNIIVKEALTYPNENGEKIAYRLHGISTDGVTGWFKCEGLRDVQSFSKQNQNLEVENYDISSFRDVIRYRNVFDSLRMVVDPDEPFFNAYRLLSKDEDCTPLNQRTITNHSQYEHDTYYSAPSLKIRTNKGIIGWSSLVGLTSFQKKKAFIDQKILITKPSRTSFDELEYYLSGEPLYYAMAQSLKEKIEYDGKEKHKETFNRYQKECTNGNFSSSLKKFYEKAERLYFLDSLALNSTYRMVSRYKVNFEIPEPLQFKLLEKEISSETLENLEKDRASNRSESIVKTKEVKFPEVQYNLAPVILFGRKKLSEQLNIQLYLYPNILTNSSRTIQPQTIKNGFFKKKDFRFETKISEPIRAVLVIGTQRIPLFLEPNDSLYFEKNTQNTFVCKGKGAETVAYQQASEVLFQQIEQKIPEAQQKDSENFKAFMENAKKNKKILLDSFSNANKFTAQFTILADADITYWNATNYLKYYRAKKPNDKQFLSFLDNLEVQNDALLGSEQYRNFINEYNLFKAENKDNAGLIFGEKTLKYLKSNTLRENLNDKMSVEKWNTLQEFVSTNPYPVLNDMIKTPYQAHNAQNGSFAPSFSLKNAKDEKIKLADFEKKIVVIDFWNSQIAGIDTIMKNLKKRNAIFSKNQDIQFININTDLDRLLAKKAMKKYALQGISLQSAENDLSQSPVNELFDVKKYPTSIIIDKGQKIVLDAQTNANNQSIVKKLLEMTRF